MLNQPVTIDYPAIRRVFITHQHADPIGGLEEMAMMNVYGYKPAAGRGKLESSLRDPRRPGRAKRAEQQA